MPIYSSSDPETSRLLEEFKALNAEETEVTVACAAAGTAGNKVLFFELGKKMEAVHNRKMDVYNALSQRRIG